MARHAAEHRGPRWLKRLLVGLAAVCGLGAAAIIIPPMMFERSADVALIKADQGPFKVKPKDPGGAAIPHQETTVMGMIGGLVKGQEDVEILRPPSAVPEMPPTPTDETPAKPASDPVAPAMTAQTQDHSQVAAQDGSAAPATPSDAPSDAPLIAGSDADADAGDVKASVADNVTLDTTAETETQTAGMATPTAKPKPPKRVMVEGDDPLYLVQLAAFRDMATAREQAGLLNSKHRARLDGAELGTMKSDRGADGIFWRVVTEPLPRVEADRICASLKRAGQDCILRKFDAADG